MLELKRKINRKVSQMMTSSKGNLIRKVVFLSANIVGVIILSSSTSFAADGLFDNADKLLNDIYGKFVAMSTAAAGVGVGTGVFMKKLSLGKQDKIELGNKVIKDSVIGWATLNALGLILNFVANYTK